MIWLSNVRLQIITPTTVVPADGTAKILPSPVTRRDFESSQPIPGFDQDRSRRVYAVHRERPFLASRTDFNEFAAK